ncbi:MAG TPA: hypothetical protein VGM79_11725 [Streptosporangiaceae bacterium]|jgi:hypothetical protein
MTTIVNVTRYHLIDRVSYLALPWCILALAFVADIAILLAAATSATPHPVGGVASIFVFVFAAGLLSATRTMPFGLALGVSRRSYYLGTVLLAVILAAADGLALTVLQAVERSTGGWGINMHFFQVPYILSGPWYLTWLTSSVVLALMFVYGIWFGLVFQRWSLIGLGAFAGVQVIALTAGALAVTWADAWAGVGHFFTTLSAAGLTGVLAALAIGLAAAGLAMIRRATV